MLNEYINFFFDRLANLVEEQHSNNEYLFIIFLSELCYFVYFIVTSAYFLVICFYLIGWKMGWTIWDEILNI